jgi:uncharacterized protein YraI
MRYLISREPLRRSDIGAVANIQMPNGRLLIAARARLRLGLLTSSLCAALCSCSDSGTITTQVNLQQTPASQSKVLTTIPKGSVVKVSDCSNGWCRTSWNGRDGYILTKSVRIGGSVPRDADTDRPDGDEDNLAVPDASGDAAGPND